MQIFRVVATVALLMAGCSQPEEERPLVGDHRSPIAVDLYFSVEQCTRAGRLDQEQCSFGLQQAMAKHRRFSPRWNHPELCEREHGHGVCTPAPPLAQGQPYWRPRPVAFLARFPNEASSAPVLFAPVYEHVREGLYTGQHGGRLEPPRQVTRNPVPQSERHQVLGRLNLQRPVI